MAIAMRDGSTQSIHECAQMKDLAPLFKKKLSDDPSLLNSRNDIMLQTPLHIASGNNNVDIVKFLLEWKGSQKLDLEAKNMYGETPLHMAAKNGSNEAVGFLLRHSAFVEAKANNGMTPLHLAVWHSLLLHGENCNTTDTLLKYNANCNALDNNEMSPLNLLPKSSGNEKLRALLIKHIDEQRKWKALMLLKEAKTKMEDFERELSSIVGLHALKLQLRIWAKGMIMDERRRSLGLKISVNRTPHMVFIGSPGTGKTMVARILGKLLNMVGVLPTDKVTEVQRTDLVGEFVGHTGPKTRRKIKEAEGGILFVDEAYRLIPNQKSDDKDYGLEALEEIMSVMDSGRIVVVFAGYKDPMKRVIASNEGFCRRVTKFFYFENFNPLELAQILHIKMNDQSETSPFYGFKLHPTCTVEAVADLIEARTTEKQRKEMNGGLVVPLLENARENLDHRLGFDWGEAESLVTITLDDLEDGLLDQFSAESKQNSDSDFNLRLMMSDFWNGFF